MAKRQKALPRQMPNKVIVAEQAKATTKIKQTTAAVAEAQSLLDERRAAQQSAIRDGAEATLSITVMAQLAKLSVQRIHQIIRGK